MTHARPGEKHFTATVWITSKEFPIRTLLVHHKKNNKWLPPGGHIEWNENPIQAAIREVKEETGLDISEVIEKLTPIGRGLRIPFPRFFLEVPVPAHIDYPEHKHIDITYHVEVPHQILSLEEKESHAIGWFTLEEALMLDIFESTRIMLKEIFT